MKANPDTFQAICIGHDNIDSFQVGQRNIKCDDNATLLGIIISEACRNPKSKHNQVWDDVL